jgi:DNA-binding MarR family transcriptional regulator
LLIEYQEADMDSKTSTGRAAEARQCGKLMRHLVFTVRAHMDEALRDKQVTTAQLRFLYEVKQSPGISGAAAARACGVTPQSAQAMLVRAVERGWVERGKDAKHGHTGTLTLTRAGKSVLANANEELLALEARVWHGVRKEELRAIRETLKRALANCEAI